MDKKAYQAAFKVALPVILGYLSIGLVFGLLLAGVGQPWWLAVVMSVTIYAGTAQYLAVEFISAATPLLSIAFMTFILNSRHMFYGLSLLKRFHDAGKYKLYMIFSLTDETYALLTSVSPPPEVDENKFYFYIALINQASWITGSLAGAVIGALIPFDTAGIDFALTALFIVLLLEQWRHFRSKYPFLIGLGSAGVSALFLGFQNMLLPAVVLTTVLLFLLRRRIELNEP
jgi:4-azaleucine resistance transporter AzlC